MYVMYMHVCSRLLISCDGASDPIPAFDFLVPQLHDLAIGPSAEHSSSAGAVQARCAMSRVGLNYIYIQTVNGKVEVVEVIVICTHTFQPLSPSRPAGGIVK